MFPKIYWSISRIFFISYCQGLILYQKQQQDSVVRTSSLHKPRNLSWIHHSVFGHCDTRENRCPVWSLEVLIHDSVCLILEACGKEEYPNRVYGTTKLFALCQEVKKEEKKGLAPYDLLWDCSEELSVSPTYSKLHSFPIALWEPHLLDN